MSNPEFHTCPTCGYQWRHGQHGGHSCSDRLLKRVRELESQLPSGIEAEVCEDIAKRQQVGIKKYGKTLAENDAPLSGRIHHAFEESADQTCYLKWAEKEAMKQEERIQALEAENAKFRALLHDFAFGAGGVGCGLVQQMSRGALNKP